MGWGLSRSIDHENEPLNKQWVFDKFEDTSRPVREMVATSEEMDKAALRREERDYCAHMFMDIMKCRREWFPELYNCRPLIEKYQHCTVNDIKHRMLEYERTKRLMAREKQRLALEAN
ncbi:NADH dehydrogenase [ubiquinone] 1 beta subcomplex subunit 7-like [Ciona intestinalis]|uniref:NADH dehydrogenase [ubiquinone] 1 beta subcomplex subunit 7 n=1 Tax=Ciona intestinalis TaxID=7719 RepID=F7BC32_CIOIN|nr:NADH dehydrogenase [ubiquinone] 1 beta subcomplex subunit 7-like [Ciona intestinalis]|eukprot:XP_002123568.1 NADH dehydrogenase [ubiquinone] 1 beta subcomplex subunit 7-like [Ciona intestinalis]